MGEESLMQGFGRNDNLSPRDSFPTLLTMGDALSFDFASFGRSFLLNFDRTAVDFALPSHHSSLIPNVVGLFLPSHS